MVPMKIHPMIVDNNGEVPLRMDLIINNMTRIVRSRLKKEYIVSLPVIRIVMDIKKANKIINPEIRYLSTMLSGANEDSW